jgi:hypothetical protein
VTTVVISSGDSSGGSSRSEAVSGAA